ncbi:MAG: hypothetical protein MUF51_03065 [Vicinamibacteria bacterium]|jgi:hypothetical protein|nr:hypothetical protein [Vicinamibacteria bacterium]
MRRDLKIIAYVSGIYDLLLALPMLFAAAHVARLFGAPPPVPLINAELNGLFTLGLAIGYFWAARDLAHRRGYLWIASVFTKTCGAILFVWDHLATGSPASFLVFAVTDGTLAAIALIALLRKERP